MHNFHLYETTERILDSINDLIVTAEVMEESEVTVGTEKIMVTAMSLKLDEAAWIAGQLLMMAETGKRGPDRPPPWIGTLASHLERLRNNTPAEEPRWKSKALKSKSQHSKT